MAVPPLGLRVPRSVEDPEPGPDEAELRRALIVLDALAARRQRIGSERRPSFAAALAPPSART
jgi:hypothetical protein